MYNDFDFKIFSVIDFTDLISSAAVEQLFSIAVLIVNVKPDETD